MTSVRSEGHTVNCLICNTPQADDLFSYVTNEPVCSTCKIAFVGGAPATHAHIAKVRTALGLRDGEFAEYDRGAAARRILGRR